MKRYVAALGTHYVSMALNVIITVALIPILLAKMGPDLTGTYILLITIANLVAMGIGWLSGAGITMLAKADVQGGGADQNNVRSIYNAIFFGYLVYGSIIALCFLLASWGVGVLWFQSVSPDYLPQVQNSFIILAFFIFMNYASIADLSLLTAQLRQAEANIYRSVAQLIFGALAFLFMIFWPRLDLLLLAQAIGTTCITLWVRWSLWRQNKVPLWHCALPSRPLLKDILLTTGAPFFISGLLITTLSYIDTLVIGAALGTGAVAHYFVVTKMIEFVGLIINKISETLTPYYARISAQGRVDDLKTLYLSIGWVGYGLGFMAMIVYGVMGPALIGLWVGNQQAPDGHILYILAAGAFFMQLINRHDIVFVSAIQMIKKLLPVLFLELVLRAVLTYGLVGQWGFGAALAVNCLAQIVILFALYKHMVLPVLHVSLRDWFIYPIAVWRGGVMQHFKRLQAILQH